jgi:hypothetical protein
MSAHINQECLLDAQGAVDQFDRCPVLFPGSEISTCHPLADFNRQGGENYLLLFLKKQEIVEILLPGLHKKT